MIGRDAEGRETLRCSIVDVERQGHLTFPNEPQHASHSEVGQCSHIIFLVVYVSKTYVS